MATQILEGTWEEITEHAPSLVGKKVRVTVLEDEPAAQPTPNEETPETRKFLEKLYEAFNRREIETILSLMREDVKWANGMEGGFVHGRDAVREYWTRQFEILAPQLEALKFERDENNRSVVTVHQIIRDLTGNVLVEKTVEQIFTIENGLIKVFEIGGDVEPFLKK